MPCSNTQINNLDIVPICYTLTNLSPFLNKFSIPNAEILTYQVQVSIRHASKCLLHKVKVSFSQHFEEQTQNWRCSNFYLELKFFLYFQFFFHFVKTPTQNASHAIMSC